MSNVRFIDLDVHKDSVVMSVADTGTADVKVLCTFPNDVNKVMKQFKKLSADVSLLRVCCEAGPTESGLCRRLEQAGIDCIVVAPSHGAGKRDICCSPGLMKSARCQLRKGFAKLQLHRNI